MEYRYPGSLASVRTGRLHRLFETDAKLDSIKFLKKRIIIWRLHHDIKNKSNYNQQLLFDIFFEAANIYLITG
jgi:hypothetical protein